MASILIVEDSFSTKYELRKLTSWDYPQKEAYIYGEVIAIGVGRNSNFYELIKNVCLHWNKGMKNTKTLMR